MFNDFYFFCASLALRSSDMENKKNSILHVNFASMTKRKMKNGRDAILFKER